MTREKDRPWRLIATVLTCAFALRAWIALSGDAVLHPDEVYQTLEPAHQWIFGSGYTWPEFHYGARQWWVAGGVAAALGGAKVAGVDNPAVYIPVVELLLCALSLLVPWGMYRLGTEAYGERTGRFALIAGAFWYELVVLAPKPMTEFIATGPLLLLMAAAAKGSVATHAQAWKAAALCVIAGSIRMQYAPLAAGWIAWVGWRSKRALRWTLAGAVLSMGITVGVVDGWLWEGSPFHSYLANARWNAAMPRPGETPWWIILAQSAGASLGIGLAMLAVAAARPKRHGLVATSAAVIIALHMIPGHKEYRFFYAVIPLWLIVGADLVARTTKPLRTLAAGTAALVSGGGAWEALPWFETVWRSTHTPAAVTITFRKRDPIMDVYAWLRERDGVEGIWHRDRLAVTLPGWYHLHREVPWYDRRQGQARRLGDGGAWTAQHVTHVVTSDPRWTLRGYAEVERIGRYRILERVWDAPPVKRWTHYRPNMADSWPETRLLEEIVPEAGPVPPCQGIDIMGEDDGWCRGDGHRQRKARGKEVAGQPGVCAVER